MEEEATSLFLQQFSNLYEILHAAKGGVEEVKGAHVILASESDTKVGKRLCDAIPSL